jgi:pimeloyl-ACP methyl ester carboxylesterase
MLAAAAAAFLIALGWLARLDRGGPAHVDIELPGGIPATFYVQGESTSFGLPDPPPPGQRPPAVVLCHGFSADRSMMSVLARRLAANGYAVLAIDARGHGENRNRFDGGGDGSGLGQEFATAVEYLRSSQQVDGTRLAVVGHSMGAGAALAYATRDPNLEAAVMISGGFRLDGEHRPPNALFIYAAGDPDDLRQASDKLVSRLGSAEAESDFSQRTATRATMIPGTDHLTILLSRVAADAIVRWLDNSFGIKRPAAPVLTEPRLRAAAIAFALFVLLLPGIGWLVGSLAPSATVEDSRGIGTRFCILALVLVATLPLAASHVFTSPLAMPVTQEVASFFLVAGLILIAGMAALGRLDLRALARGCGGAAGAVVVGLILVATAMTPLGVVLHRLGLTPERALVAVGLTLAFLPLYLALELLLRRGTTSVAAIASAGGRLLVLGVLMLGVAIGVLPWVIALMLPVVVVIFVLGEIVAWPIYARSRNRSAIALMQAAWFAWLVAATMAIRL